MPYLFEHRIYIIDVYYVHDEVSFAGQLWYTYIVGFQRKIDGLYLFEVNTFLRTNNALKLKNAYSDFNYAERQFFRKGKKPTYQSSHLLQNTRPLVR